MCAFADGLSELANARLRGLPAGQPAAGAALQRKRLQSDQAGPDRLRTCAGGVATPWSVDWLTFHACRLQSGITGVYAGWQRLWTARMLSCG